MPSDASSTERIEGILKITEKGADVVSKGASFATAVLKFMNTVAEGENKQKVAEKAAHWESTAAPNKPALEKQLENSKREKQEFLSDVALKTAKFAYENAGKLVESSGLLQLSPTLFASVNPFLGSVVCAGVIAFDGILTRKTIRDESLKTQNAIMQLQTSMERGFSELSSTFSSGFSELTWRLVEHKAVLKDLYDLVANPHKTHEDELKARGIEGYNFGWFAEALESFRDAEKTIKTDYIIYYYMANIHLVAEPPLRNYGLAAEYYGKAAKYSEPRDKPPPSFTIFALMQKGLAHYLAGSRERPQEYAAAADSLKQAIRLAEKRALPQVIPELKYQLAHYSILVPDRSGQALPLLREVLLVNPSYIVKVVAEDDFLIAQGEVKKTIKSVLADLSKRLAKLYKKVTAEIDRHNVFLNVVKADGSTYYDTAHFAKYYDEMARISSLYAEGTFESLTEAEARLSKLKIPISHPSAAYEFYEYSTLYGKEMRRFYTSEAPPESRHPFRTRFWPIVGELL